MKLFAISFAIFLAGFLLGSRSITDKCRDGWHWEEGRTAYYCMAFEGETVP